MELDPLSTRTLWFYYVSFLYCTVLYCAVGTLGAHFTIYKGAGSDLQVPTVLRCTVLYRTSGVTKPYDYNILAGITRVGQCGESSPNAGIIEPKGC